MALERANIDIGVDVAAGNLNEIAGRLNEQFTEVNSKVRELDQALNDSGITTEKIQELTGQTATSLSEGLAVLTKQRASKNERLNALNLVLKYKPFN